MFYNIKNGLNVGDGIWSSGWNESWEGLLPWWRFNILSGSHLQSQEQKQLEYFSLHLILKVSILAFFLLTSGCFPLFKRAGIILNHFNDSMSINYRFFHLCIGNRFHKGLNTMLCAFLFFENNKRKKMDDLTSYKTDLSLKDKNYFRQYSSCFEQNSAKSWPY